MKFAAAATLVLAGVAQAAVANQAGNQGFAGMDAAGAMDANAMGAANMDGMTILSQLYGQTSAAGYGKSKGKGGYGGDGGDGGKRPGLGKLFKKLSCALPCVEDGLRKTKCKGNPLDSICDSIDQIKQDSQKCLYKCKVDKSVIDLCTKAAHFVCDKRQKKGGDKKQY